MNKDVEEMMRIYNKWNVLNPHQSKKTCENKKTFNFDENQLKNLYNRKPSLPNISPMSNNRSNYLINSKPKGDLGRKSMFSMDKSYSTNNLSIFNHYNTNLIQKDRSVYVDFPNTRTHLSTLQSTSGEEIHTYEFVQMFPKNPENPYLELKNPNFDDDIATLIEFAKKSQTKEENDSVFSGNASEILDYPYKPKNSLEIIRKKIRKTSIKSHAEVQDVFETNVEFHRPHSQEENFEPEFLKKMHIYCPDKNKNNTKLSNDSGISAGNITNQQSLSNLILSTSQDQMNLTDSAMNSSDSIQLHEKFNDLDFPKMEHGTVSSSLESQSKTLKINTEEDHALLRRMISKELTKQSYSVKEIIKFYFQDNTYSSQITDELECAASVCDKLVQHLNKSTRSYWQLFEFIHNESLERPIEDHENIQEIFKSWNEEFLHNRFILKENLNLYTLFSKPNIFATEMENNFQINGFIWIKEINSRWKKVFASISESTIYFDFRPDAKNIEVSHSFVNLQKFDFYTCTDQNKIKKIFKAPTNELIVLKSKKLENKSQNYPCICALTVKEKERWIEAMKIAKFTFSQLKKNYLEFEKKSDPGSRTRSYSSKPPFPLTTDFCPKSV